MHHAAHLRASLGAAALITLLGPSALAQPAPSTSPTSPAAQPSPAQAQTAWFSDAQASAARGDYATACAACHGGTLGGGSAPALKGAGFLRKWSGRSLRDLWQEVHTLMPLTAPGSMTETQSLGLMALILQDNGFPSGEGALQTASLDRTITPPATAGQPPPVVAGKPPEVAVSQPVGHAPTQAELDAADTDGTNWLMYNKGYMGYRYSPLKEIDRTNAARLRPVCMFQLGEIGPFHAGPVIYDGTMYVTTAHGVYAIDAATCRKQWDYHYQPWGPEVQPNNKGVAIADGRVIRGTPDGALIALDAKTGKLLWQRQIMDPTLGEFAAAAPIVWKDLVFMGKAGGDWGIDGAMMAFKASDGSEVWNFGWLPRGDAPGADSWKDPQSALKGGGSTWSTYSLDAKDNMLLVPIGNPSPDFHPEMRPGDNLYTNSVVSLDPATGKLKWYYQLVPNDGHDWDTTVAAAFDGPGGEKLVAAAGKDGVLTVLDRADGKLKFKVPIVRQENTDTPIGQERVHFCPVQALLYNGAAYSPATHLLYINSQDWCAYAVMGPQPKYVKGMQYAGWANGFGTRDPLDQSIGWTTAIDAASGKIKWRLRLPGVPMIAAVTPTAGDVVFTGDTAGNFLVLDATDGKVLYSFNTGGSFGGGVATYSVHGRQYVAAMTGNTSFAKYLAGGAPTVVVFGL